MRDPDPDAPYPDPDPYPDDWLILNCANCRAPLLGLETYRRLVKGQEYVSVGGRATLPAGCPPLREVAGGRPYCPDCLEKPAPPAGGFYHPEDTSPWQDIAIRNLEDLSGSVDLPEPS